MFGVFKKRSNKSSKRVNRKRRTSKRRTNRRRQQRGGMSEYASAYGAGGASDDAPEGFMGRENFEAKMTEEGMGAKPEAPDMKEEYTGAPAPVKGGAGMMPGMGGGRRRRKGGRKNQGSEMLVPAALLAANLYGPGSKSRRNRRKSRKNRSQRKRR